MARGYITINEAAHQWVGEFNAIPQGMIAKLMQADSEDWHEVTLPSVGDRVCVYNLPDEADTLEHGGELWSCELCGATLCTKCYVERHGRQNYDEMMWSGGYILCPNCEDKLGIEERAAERRMKRMREEKTL